MPLLFLCDFFHPDMIFALEINTLWFSNNYNCLTIEFKIHIITPNLI